MERKRNLYITGFLVIMYSVGIVGHLTDVLRPLMLLLTPFTLLLTGGIVAWHFLPPYEPAKIRWLLITWLITFSIEVIGVKTGLVFGAYIYGDTLGVKLLEVPLIIGFNWVIIILGLLHTAKRLRLSRFTDALFTGAAAVVIDIFLEPVAIMLDYWQWDGGAVPLQNYAAWFVIAFTAAFFYPRVENTSRSVVVEWYVVIQFIFFVVLFVFM